MSRVSAKPLVFTFWQNPPEGAPGYIDLCLKTISRNLSDFEHVALDFESALTWVPERDDLWQMSVPRDRGRSVSGAGRRYAIFSDLLRLSLLQRHGGLWIDVDTVAFPGLNELAPLVAELDLVVGETAKGEVGNGVVGGRVGSPLLAEAWRRLSTTLDAKRRSEAVTARWGEYGGQLLSDLVTELEESPVWLGPYGTLYTWDTSEPLRPVFNKGDLSSLPPSALVLEVCNNATDLSTRARQSAALAASDTLFGHAWRVAMGREASRSLYPTSTNQLRGVNRVATYRKQQARLRATTETRKELQARLRRANQRARRFRMRADRADLRMADQLRVERRWREAAEASESLIDSPIVGTGASRLRCDMLMKLQRWEEARTIAETLYEDVAKRNVDDVRRMMQCLSHDGSYEGASAVLARHAETERDTFPDGKALILMAAEPKTGSTSMTTALAAAAGYGESTFLCHDVGPRPEARPSFEALEVLRGKGLANHSHLVPEPESLGRLESMPWVKLLVQVRHPVDVMESTIDMLVRTASAVILSGAEGIDPSDTRVVQDWVLDEYLPGHIQRVMEWVRIADEGHPALLGLTTLEEVRSHGQDAVAQRALAARGIRTTSVTTQAKRTGKRLCGNNAISLSAAERQRVMTAVPAALRFRFGWG